MLALLLALFLLVEFVDLLLFWGKVVDTCVLEEPLELLHLISLALACVLALLLLGFEGVQVYVLAHVRLEQFSRLTYGLQNPLKARCVLDDKLLDSSSRQTTLRLLFLLVENIQLASKFGEGKLVEREPSTESLLKLQNALSSASWAVSVHMLHQKWFKVVLCVGLRALDDALDVFVPNLHLVDKHLVLFQLFGPVSELWLRVPCDIVFWRCQLLHGVHIKRPLRSDVRSLLQRARVWSWLALALSPECVLSHILVLVVVRNTLVLLPLQEGQENCLLSLLLPLSISVTLLFLPFLLVDDEVEDLGGFGAVTLSPREVLDHVVYNHRSIRRLFDGNSSSTHLWYLLYFAQNVYAVGFRPD